VPIQSDGFVNGTVVFAPVIVPILRLTGDLNTGWIRGSIRFRTRADAHAYLFEFIEPFYNRQCHQAGLNHLTPAEYHDRWRQTHQS
jgi:hypothetical protein